MMSFLEEPATPPRSRSTRTTCWRCAMMRVFTIVGIDGSAKSPSVEIPSSRRRRVSLSPESSVPTIPSMVTEAVNSLRFLATLAAPPG